MSVHGTDGPVQVSYPRFFYPQSGRSRCPRLAYDALLLRLQYAEDVLMVTSESF